MSRHGGTNRRLLVAAAALVMVIPGAGRAQVRQQSGRALDANLRLGSGGYNSIVAGGSSPFERQFYTPRSGAIERHFAFARERFYAANRGAPDWVWRVEDDQAWSTQGAPAAWLRPVPRWDPGYTPEPLAAPLRVASPASGVPAASTAAPLDVLSYAVGFQLGREIRRGLDHDGVELDTEPTSEGFRDGASGREPRIGRDRLQEILAAIKDRVDGRAVERLRDQDPGFRLLLVRNLADGRASREAFAQRDGVVALPNGIHYQVLTGGAGPSPGPDDRVIVRYRLMDPEGKPLAEATREIAVREAVPGAAQLLLMMRVGDRWLVSIPPELAFGTHGRLPEIEPNATVIAEMELVRIQER